MSSEFSRRQFLIASAAAAGASWFDLPRVLGAPRASAGAYAGFPMGIQSYTFRKFNLDQTLDKIHKLGLHFAEFYPAHVPVSDDRAQAQPINDKMNRHDITLSALGVFRISNNPQANRRIFQFADWTRVRNLSVNPDLDAMDNLEKLVDEFGIRIGIHNHGPTSRYSTVEDVQQAVRGRHPLIGACVDTGHYIRSGVDPVHAIRTLGDRVHGVHLKDYASAGENPPETIIGQGKLDVVGVFEALRDAGFPADGSLSLEYEDHPQHPMADVRRGLKIASQAARKAAGLTA